MQQNKQTSKKPNQQPKKEKTKNHQDPKIRKKTPTVVMVNKIVIQILWSQCDKTGFQQCIALMGLNKPCCRVKKKKKKGKKVKGGSRKYFPNYFIN